MVLDGCTEWYNLVTVLTMTYPATAASRAPVDIDATALRAARDERRFTQAELGRLCGITAQYVSFLETGQRPRVSRAVLADLARALKVDADALRRQSAEAA